MPVKKGLSYLQMTLRKYREMGRIVDKTEYWNPYGGKVGIRVDPFGFLDALALDSAEGIIAIQSCAGSGHSKHKQAILQNEYALEWLKCGGKIELISWRKLLVKRGGKLKIWQPRIEQISLKDFTYGQN